MVDPAWSEPWWTGHPDTDIDRMEAEYNKHKAEFVVAMRGAITWTEYDNLTADEINACITALNKAHKK